MLKMDKNQIEAAADLGANPTRVFFSIKRSFEDGVILPNPRRIVNLTVA